MSGSRERESREKDDVRQEVEQWNVDALTMRYKIAKAALLDDFDKLGALIPKGVRTRDISSADLKQFPLFRALREEPLFLDLLRDAEEHQLGNEEQPGYTSG